MSTKRTNSNNSKYILKTIRSPTKLSKQIRKQSKDSDSSCSEKRYGKFWKPHEDNQLIELHLKFNGNWKLIAQEMVQRNTSQCQQRWKRINPNKSKLRKQWTDEEDKEVIRLVEINGRNWKTIEGFMNGRTSKQIRERFLNNLDPEINREKFSEAEDQIILQQYKIYGPKWSEIAKNLDRRPVNNVFIQENQVKNRFYSYIKRVSQLDDDDDEDENDNDNEEMSLEQEDNKIHLETIHSLKDEADNTKNDSLINLGAYNRTPSNRLQPSINLIQGIPYQLILDSFDSKNFQAEEFEISPNNYNQRKILDYSPINFQNAHMTLNFDVVHEDYRELRSQIESISLDKNN